MLRRIATILALAALAGPAAARANEWEEDYTGDDPQSEASPPSDVDYPVSVDETPPPSLETFETSLSPYGEWVVAGGYGRVWRPHAATGWRPYFYGRWEWTHEGWLWVSDEPFGWAAYHYGRWALEPRLGWVWVPGYEWAPAWVSWRYSDEVVGWAPLGPGVSVYVSTIPFVDTSWTFVPCHRFVAEPVDRIAYERGFGTRFFRETRPAPARPAMRPVPGRRVVAPVWGGPPPRAIEQRIGRPIVPMRVIAAPSPGAAHAGAGEVSIFRPGMRPGAPAVRPMPPRVEGRGSSAGPAFHPIAPPARVTPPPARAENPRPGAPRSWFGGGAPPRPPASSHPQQDRGGGFAPHAWRGADQGGGGGPSLGPQRSPAREDFRPRTPEPRRESTLPRMGRGERGGR